MTIMLSYAYAEHVHGVVYWAWPDLVDLLQGIAEEANQTAEAAGMRPCVIVRPWQPRL
ncbi:hypothetical protein [Streptomyces sp. GSL17-111]|uniref:hypothetical protein n=1 Tax=Streptomyces sp. GSL17-111 TaxID=3121596 RepID=UPI0030F42676